MNLIRLIGIAILFWLLYRLILALLNKARRPAQRPQPMVNGESMVRCEECGVHVPKSEALIYRDKYYCCEEHRNKVDSWKRDE